MRCEFINDLICTFPSFADEVFIKCGELQKFLNKIWHSWHFLINVLWEKFLFYCWLLVGLHRLKSPDYLVLCCIYNALQSWNTTVIFICSCIYFFCTLDVQFFWMCILIIILIIHNHHTWWRIIDIIIRTL